MRLATQVVFAGDDRIEEDIHPVGEHILQRRRTAAVGHMDQVDAHGAFHEFAVDMTDGGRAARAKIEATVFAGASL